MRVWLAWILCGMAGFPCAGRGFGQEERKAEVERLIEALREPDTNDRRLAAEALVRIGEPAVKPLIAALGDSWWVVRSSAAGSLGELGDPRAVEPLIAALKDSGWDVRRSAAWALGEIGGPRAVEPLIAALDDSDSVVRGSAAEALARIGEPAVEPLITALKDFDGDVRASVARALGELGDPRAVDPLIAALKDTDEVVRRSVAKALDQLGDPLGSMLFHVYIGMHGALETLSASNAPRVVEPLIAALKDFDAEVRQSAAEALGRLGDPRGVDPLIAALKDSDRNVCRAVAKALGQLGDPRAVAPLIAMLKDGEKSVRSSAAEALGELGDPRAVLPLISALRDWRVRATVATSLGILGDPQAAAPLSGLLRVKDGDARRSAARALAKLGNPGIAELFAALGTSQEEVRSDVLRAFQEGDASIARLTLDCLRGDSDSTEQLSRSGDLRVTGTFLTAARDADGAFRASAIAAFGTLSRNEIFLEPVVESLGSSSREARLGAGRLLAATGSPFSLGFAGHCAKGVFSSATLAYGAGFFVLSGLPLLWKRFRWRDGLDVWVAALACWLAYKVIVSSGGMVLFSVVPFVVWFWGRKPPLPRLPWLPGWAGWTALGALVVSAALYGRYLLDGPGGWVLMAVSLAPLWLALLGGFVQGAVRWPRTWRRVRESVCQTHYSRFAPHARSWPVRWSGGALWRPDGWDGDLTATCGCRVCGKREPSLPGIRRVVAVLDDEGDWVEQNSVVGELRVNWMKHRRPFDFDSVEIDKATDADVESFTNQMRFEGDHSIAKRLPKLPCRVDPACGLSDGSRRLLAATFGEAAN